MFSSGSASPQKLLYSPRGSDLLVFVCAQPALFFELFEAVSQVAHRAQVLSHSWASQHGQEFFPG